MKKAICLVALAAVTTFGTVYAAPVSSTDNTPVAQQDTTKKKMKMKDDKKK